VTGLVPVKAYRAEYLREAIGSVLQQTSADWRLLVITEKRQRSQLESVLVEQLADPRIDLVTKEGRQLAGSLNTGMRRAETEFVAILLGDDVWSPATVEVLTKHIVASPEIDFFHSARRAMDAEGRLISSVMPSRPSVSVDDFAIKSPVKHLLCWRRERGLSIGGMDESLNSVGVDDYDFPWSMAESGAKFKAIPDCLYIFRDHREFFRLTTHLPLSHHKRELARVLRKHGVDEPTVIQRVAEAERTYLRQCLYRSRLDRWMKRLRRHEARTGWRQRYR
jgi:glycosyltransferase involved in cell wall biosynthesis